VVRKDFIASGSMSGAAPIAADVLEFFDASGVTVLEGWGLSETTAAGCLNTIADRRIGTVGPPLPGVDVRIADDGEILLRGPQVFDGYLNDPEATESAFAEGWFRTGDLGFRESDGYLILCGRSKDLIISGGLNIYPPEVERVLAEHPAVAACAVIGCQDREWGERVTAVVVLNRGESASGSDLIAFCRERLAPYKSPKSIVFKDELPRNAMGKVQKAELRKTVCSDHS